jgi:hypothetical protein
MPPITRERASACAGHRVHQNRAGTNEGITMNTQLLEAPSSPVRSSQHVATHPSAASLSTSSSSAADRLALRLGMALVIWGRRHVDRVDARSRAAAGAVHEQERNDRELAAQRLLQLTVPRR